MHASFRALFALLFFPLLAQAQQPIVLNDLSAWKTSNAAGANWQIAADVSAAMEEKYNMTPKPGTGVLVNLPTDKDKANLLSVAEYGDVDVSFDFMMAAHSNSGFYLQGRYEVQLLDSWGVQSPRYGDCGGIYGRRRFVPEAQMYEGHAPRQNACTAPGLWQHMEISFQAPRFDAKGTKIANAKMLKVVLNGVLVHENVELTGPTGGPISEQEAAKGPFMIQGDHGPVAFRHFSVRPCDGQPPALAPVSFKVWYGKFREASEFLSKKPDGMGNMEKLHWNASKQESDYGIVYNTALLATKPGKYRLITQLAGRSILKVNGKEVLSDAWSHSSGQRFAEVELPVGNTPLEITVYKMDDWMPPVVGLWVEGPDTRPIEYHAMSSLLGLPYSDPIYLDAPTPMVFRSFMDLPFVEGQPTNYQTRLSHAVNVGHPSKLHYTYDLDNGGIAQIWRGDFLYTSPMWDNRGDGSSRPRGSVLLLGDHPLVITTAQINAPAPAPAAMVQSGDVFTTTLERMRKNAGFRPLGYDVDDNNYPTFRYEIYGASVEDQIRVGEQGKFLTHTLSFKNAAPNLLCRLASGDTISDLGKGVWMVGDKQYYIKVANNAPARVENVEGKAALVVPASEKVEFSLVW